MNNLYDTVAEHRYLKSFKEIIDRAKMADELKKGGPYTVFAPHNGAFNLYTTYDPDDEAHEYLQAPLESILSSPETARLTLLHLLIPQKLTFENLSRLTSITALDGNSIPIETTNGNLIVGNSPIMNFDMECTNGIIHVTGELLQPTLIFQTT